MSILSKEAAPQQMRRIVARAIDKETKRPVAITVHLPQSLRRLFVDSHAHSDLWKQVAEQAARNAGIGPLKIHAILADHEIDAFIEEIEAEYVDAQNGFIVVRIETVPVES